MSGEIGTDTNTRPVKIFYSWQSDLPNSTNRGFIETALRKAAKALRLDDSIEVEPVVERDTQGVSGAPDIVQTIFAKLSSADIVVADVSIISGPRPRKGKRPVPNPNVLVELGYAVGRHDWNRIVLVANTAYGALSLLPFDLQQRRCIPYEIHERAEDKASARTRLAGTLEYRLKECISALPSKAVNSQDDDQAAVESAIVGLNARTLRYDGVLYRLDHIFSMVGPVAAVGASEYEIAAECFGKFGFPNLDARVARVTSRDIIGPWLVYGLLEQYVEKQPGNYPKQPTYHLTKIGKRVLRHLDHAIF